MKYSAFRKLLVAFGAALAISGSALAQSEAAPSAATQTAFAGSMPDRVALSDIVGKPVVSPQGETLGKIEDAIVERDRGLTQAILLVGGALGFGGKRIAVPYDELRHQGKEGYVLDATLDSLKARPAYTEEALPSSAPRDGRGTVSKAEGKFDEWKGKLDDYTNKAESEGTEAGRLAAEKITRAWESVKAQWSRLEAATDDTMQDAMRAFEEAWRNFQRNWEDNTSET